MDVAEPKLTTATDASTLWTVEVVEMAAACTLRSAATAAAFTVGAAREALDDASSVRVTMKVAVDCNSRLFAVGSWRARRDELMMLQRGSAPQSVRSSAPFN